MKQSFILKPLALALLLSSLAGCSLFSDELVDTSPRLDSLEPARPPVVAPLVADAELDQVQARYQSALAVAEEESIRRNIHERLAELAMVRAEQVLLEGTEDPAPYFNEVIRQYRALLAYPVDQHFTAAARQEALYQLAKAQALLGDTDGSTQTLTQLTELHPEAAFVAEAQFRRAEAAFSQGDYVTAALGYQAVIDAGPGTPYFVNANYMHGWAMFKRGLYVPALDSYTAVLDQLLPAGAEPDGLAASARNLLDDSLRIMAVTFSYLDGADSIEQTYAGNKRHYHYLLYRQLGELYLSQQRYRDSADTYAHYVANNALDRHSPDFSVREIDVYGLGNFPSLILPAKQNYVRNYGANSHYWAGLDEPARAALRPNLHSYLQELASYEHSSAQQAGRDLDKLREDKALKGEARDKAIAALSEKRSGHYQQAALWYAEFISTFPDDEKTSEMTFLMAEALYESNKMEQAFTAFERVAYLFKDPERGAEAGYSALLAATRVVESGALSAEDQAAWQELRIASGLRFADSYRSDPRAVRVLARAADELLQLGRYEEAIVAATRVTQWQPEADKDLRKSAWLILAQSQYDTGNYAQAELAYNQVLEFLPAKDPQRADITQRIAASVYKNAELLLAAGLTAQAVDQLVRVQGLAPDSDIAIAAQYDAATHMMELARYAEAEQLLTDFRKRYPNHKLTASITPKMILLHEKQENWSAAATELLAQVATSQDPELIRQSKYLAAEYFEKAGDTSRAINEFRDYAHNYPAPFGQNLEAQNKLQALYQAEGNVQNRDYWLRKIIETDRTAGANRSDRSITLAAMATSVRAQDFYDEFEDIQLTQPLKITLARKKKALQITLDMYQQLLNYGVAEYTTEASHRIGAVYAQLSRDLMASQRPKGLDELELEQYEILLEEQAFPFEEQAIGIFEANAQRAWTGTYDDWVKHSFSELARLLPARYRKTEAVLEVSDALR